MNREIKLVGFVILLGLIFVGAHVAGAHLGPLTTSYAQVSGPTGGSGSGSGGGMRMGGQP